MRQRFANWSAAIGIALCLSSPALSQTYVESFDGPLWSVMLGGNLKIASDETWTNRLVNGSFQYLNTTDPNAVRYQRIDYVVFPNTNVPLETQDMTIEADVLVSSDEKAGAGVLGRYNTQTEDYVLGIVGSHGEYYVGIRSGGRGSNQPPSVRLMAAGIHPAIRQGATNTVRLSTDDDDLVFAANGTELIRIPAPRENSPRFRPGMSDPRNRPQERDVSRLVGIVAFGKGSFTFEEVRVMPAFSSQPEAVEPAGLPPEAADPIPQPPEAADPARQPPQSYEPTPQP